MLPDPLTERCLVTETTLAKLGQLCGVGVALFWLELDCNLRGKQKMKRQFCSSSSQAASKRESVPVCPRVKKLTVTKSMFRAWYWSVRIVPLQNSHMSGGCLDCQVWTVAATPDWSLLGLMNTDWSHWTGPFSCVCAAGAFWSFYSGIIWQIIWCVVCCWPFSLTVRSGQWLNQAFSNWGSWPKQSRLFPGWFWNHCSLTPLSALTF